VFVNQKNVFALRDVMEGDVDAAFVQLQSAVDGGWATIGNQAEATAIVFES